MEESRVGEKDGNVNKEDNGQYSILILGGCGFVGRNFLLFLLNEKLVRYVKIVDKVTPIMAYLHPLHMTCFQSSLVEFQQADLTKSDHLDRIFQNHSFDFVFNLASETRSGQPEHVYASRCSDLSYLCAVKSAESGVKRFIEVSSAFVYGNSSQQCTENSPINPITMQAKYKHQAELRLLELCQSISFIEDQRPTPALEIVILRPSQIYGIGDTHLLMTRIICASLYQFSLHESMTLPYSGEIGINTVHIIDVCTALWHCAINRKRIPSGSIFNLSDKNETNQENFTRILSDILGVEYSFYGYMINTLIRHRPHEVVGYVNYKHLKAWDRLCQTHNVLNTPLSPYITADNLMEHSLTVDGSLIESYGFHYRYPKIIPDEIKHCILFSIETGIFPPVIS